MAEYLTAITEQLGIPIWLFVACIYSIKFSLHVEEKIMIYFFLPAFLDWALSGLKIFHSNNTIRFFSGVVASIALSRWWYLAINKIYFYIVLKTALIYFIAIIIMFIFIYKQKEF